MELMPRTSGTPRKPGTRPSRPYHHGDLRRALLREAARAIRSEGPDGVTLRDVGRRLGVSRTALYRHFADKGALLASVAREGFQTFSRELQAAWTEAGGGMEGFEAMGAAYVRFAIANQAHYRIMFGRFKDLCSSDAALAADASASFQVLVDALVSLQRDGMIRAGDPEELGRYIWATVHGVAMLAIDGQLGPGRAAADSLTTFAIARLSASVRLSRPPSGGRESSG
jgi:AcrR family transcriptional regulator